MDNINITVNETIENIVVNPSITTEVIDVNITGTTETVNIDVTPNLTTININSISGSPVTKTSDLINDGEDGINPFITLADVPPGGLTSVGLSMPVAFNVANSPLTSNGTLAVSAVGTSSQYIRGDGQLATLPTGAGGGSTVSYYLNGSINASVAGYKQLSNTATIGGGTDFTLTGNGLIAQFLTDAGNPNRLEIPGGAWNFEMFFQANSAGGNQKFYVELLKYNGTTFTSIASTILVPEEITGGTAIDLYLTSLAVPTTPLLVTDRLAIRVYIVDNAVGRTITLHTEDNTLCEIITTFSGGVTSLNGLTANTQYLAVGTTGSDFNISSLTDTHTFNLPTASATNRGALSSADWTAFNGKFTLPTLTSGSVLFSNGTTIAQDNSNFFWDDTNNRLLLNGTTDSYSDLVVTSKIGVKATAAKSAELNLYDQTATNSIFIIKRQSGATGNMGLPAGTAEIGTYNNIALGIYSGGNYLAFGVSTSTERARFAATTGNLLINTTTDQGGKLQIKAPGALSTDIALRVRNSADTGDLMTVNGLGNVGIGVAPSYKLDVTGIVRLNGSSGNDIITDTTNVTLNGYATASSLIRFQSRNAANALIYKLVIPSATDTAAYFVGNVGFGTSTPIASAKVQIDSTTQGVLFPRMTTTQKNAIATPASGLVVYDTTLGKLCVRGAAAWETITSI